MCQFFSEKAFHFERKSYVNLTLFHYFDGLIVKFFRSLVLEETHVLLEIQSVM